MAVTRRPLRLPGSRKVSAMIEEYVKKRLGALDQVEDFLLPEHPLLDRDYWGRSKKEVVAEIEAMIEDYYHPFLPYRAFYPLAGDRLKTQLEIVQRMRPYVPDLLDKAYEQLAAKGRDSFGGETVAKADFRKMVARLPDPRSVPAGRGVMMPITKPAEFFTYSDVPVSTKLSVVTFEVREGVYMAEGGVVMVALCWILNGIQVTDWIYTDQVSPIAWQELLERNQGER